MCNCIFERVIHGSINYNSLISYGYFHKGLQISGSCEDTYGKDYLISPNYPQNHDANEDCRWLITAPVDNILTMTFLDFDTNADLFVYDGANVHSQLLKKVSLPLFPGLIISTGNRLYIRLNTRVLRRDIVESYTRRLKVEIGNIGNHT